MIPDFKKHFRKNLSLAYPVMLSHLGQMTVIVADNMMVGRLGKEPLAGASFGNSIFVIFLVMGIGMSYAITPQTAQADGEKNISKLTEILKHGILINIIFGILLTAVIRSGRDLLWQFNQPDTVVELALPYLQILAYSLIPFMIYQAFRQFAEGLGFTKQAMYITLSANILNIVLNYIFIFGKLGFEPMGLYGAGLATFLSRILMAILMAAFVYLNRRFTPYWKVFSFGNFSWSLIRENIRLGLPMAFQLIFEVSTFSIAAVMIGWIGAGPLAAHQIAINMASITYMIALGLAAAATIRVGNQLGQKDYKTMRNAAMTGFIMAAAFMSLTAILFVSGRHFLPTLYIEDESVVRQAAVLLIVAALFQLSDGIQVIGLGALRGMSDVKKPTIITLIAYWLIGLPLGYVLGFYFDQGAVGVWYGLLAGLSMAAVLLFIRFNNLSKNLILNQTGPRARFRSGNEPGI
ncbi:MAG: MATE family efflux transporter [Cytophagales bacterium]|nr:MATE family efflux transporter [Cytophagales bacterium]